MSKIKWTYDICKERALTYNTKKELFQNDVGVIRTIWKNKWYELCDHMELLGNRYERLIYAYEFSDNYCYIGLTGDMHRRNLQHTTDCNSSVYKHIQKTGLVPLLIKKSEYIDVDEASILEGLVEQDYINNGWNILNKIRTGGIGGVCKWDYNLCKDEALKYTLITDFIKNSNGAYVYSRKNGFIDQITKHS